MDKKTTLDDLSNFYKNEKKLLQFLVDMEDSPSFSEEISPCTISNILAYSKVLSIRDTTYLGKIDFVLN